MCASGAITICEWRWLLTGDWHAAEDLVQASLVKLYRAWPRLDTDADPDAYPRRIMINTHRSWCREVTFGDFGVPVSVSAPPASQTWTPLAG